MIIELIIKAIAAVVSWLASLLPNGDVPDWVGEWSDSLGDLADLFSGLGAWVPLELMVVIGTALLLCIVIGFAIRLVRIIASFLLAGGGSAG